MTQAGAQCQIVKLQMAVLQTDTEEIQLRGDPESASFAVRLHAIEAVNCPAEFIAARRIMAHGASA